MFCLLSFGFCWLYGVVLLFICLLSWDLVGVADVGFVVLTVVV